MPDPNVVRYRRLVVRVHGQASGAPLRRRAPRATAAVAGPGAACGRRGAGGCTRVDYTIHLTALSKLLYW